MIGLPKPVFDSLKKHIDNTHIDRRLISECEGILRELLEKKKELNKDNLDTEEKT